MIVVIEKMKAEIKKMKVFIQTEVMLTPKKMLEIIEEVDQVVIPKKREVMTERWVTTKEMTEKMTEEMIEGITEETTEEVIEEMTEEMTEEEVIEGMTEEIEEMIDMKIEMMKITQKYI